MKKSAVWVFLCVMGVAAQAVLIDDFEDTGLAEYTKSVVLEQSGTNAISFASPAGTIQASKAADSGAEQVLYLRDDYSLGVGETLRVDAAVASTTNYADIGIVVSATVDPPDAVWTSGTADVRQNYINMYIKAGSSGWGCIAFDGTTMVLSTYITAQDLSVITGLFINRTSATTFELGYTTAAGDTVYQTATVANTSIGNAVGIYADLRAEFTIGDLDNLRIWSTLYEAHDPNPADGADMVGTPIGTTGYVDVELAWKAGIDPDGVYLINPAIKKHYVYLSKDQTVYTSDPNLYYVGAVDQVSSTDPNAAYVPDPPLRSGGQYLWMVEEGLDNGLSGVYGPGDPNNIPGQTWAFETVSTIPVITTQPVAATVVLGTSVDPAFTIDVFSTTTAHYQWYYSTDDVIGSDTTVGSDQPSLAIANAQMTDQGYYYCRVWNDATVSGGGSAPDVYSSVVTLTIGRLVAEYKFEENLTDSSGEGNHGNEADPNKPTFDNTEALDGYYAVFNGINQYVDFGTAAYPKAGPLANGIGGGLNEGTITCWVKASQVGGLLTNYNDGITTGFALSLETNSGTADTRMNARGEAADVGTVQGRPGMTGYDVLTDGRWHMMTAAWKAGDTMTVYVDGGPVNSVAAGTPAAYAAWQRGVLLGTTRNAADRDILQNFYGGQVDNLRVYNYRQTLDQIANEYYTVTGNPACTDPDFVGSDFNYDNTLSSYCKIDLADFAIFVQNWLADGLSTGE